MVTDPELIVADEPTGDLDTKSADEVLKLMEILRAQLNKTIIMVTHENDIAAWARRVVRMRDGHVESDVRNEPAPTAPPTGDVALVLPRVLAADGFWPSNGALDAGGP